MEQIVLEEYTFIECKANSILVGKFFLLFTCSFIVFHMSLCGFCFFKVRNSPENLSEAKRIAFSMYVFLTSLLAYHPVEFSMDGWMVCKSCGLFHDTAECLRFPLMYILAKNSYHSP